MRLSFLLAAALTVAAPAFGQELGQRTQRPETILDELGLAPDQDDLRDALAAAAAHPLGSRENPVRVGGPEGERAYIARLRCADGSAPRVGPRSNDGVGAFGTIVDAYLLDWTLVMDMYHSEHLEDRAPPGFSILSR
jgi:hypothetical protein